MKKFELIVTVRRDKDKPLDKEHFPRLIKKMYDNGVRIFRINLAKFSKEYFDVVAEDISAARKCVDKDVVFMLDFPFPGKKSRLILQEKMYLDVNDDVTLFSNGVVSQLGERQVAINTDCIGSKMKIRDIVSYGDGTVYFEVKKVVDNDTVILKTLNKGFIEGTKALNFNNSLQKDDTLLEQIKYMIDKTDCESIALSFVENSKQIEEVRNYLGNIKCKIVAKIENDKGIKNIEDIVQNVDEVMLGRGDLGLFSDISTFGLAQDKVVNMCKKYNKPVWLATDFLTSMESRILPTRSELIDVYNAKKIGADGVIITYGVVRSNQSIEAIKVIENQKVE